MARTATCPACGLGYPMDVPEGVPSCICGSLWGIAPFPKAELTGPEWEHLTQLLLARCGGRCEGCGQPFVPGKREANRHHRRGRKMGGTNRPDTHSLANLLMLCAGFSARLGGVLGCHGRVDADRGWAEARGLIVPEGEAGPAEVPLVLPSGRRVLLDPLSPFYLTPTDGILYTAVA